MSSPITSSEPSPRKGDAYSLPATRYSLLLISYFRSGWAFLIPYLAAYLLYAWLKWPVNPAAGGEGIVKGVSESVGSLPSTAHSLLSTGVPYLLHVYWFLHAIHLIFGTLALRSWWKAPAVELQFSTSTDACSARPPPTIHRLPSGMDRLWAAMPWLCLSLLIWIPGVYLEMPADPWAHFSRMSDWQYTSNPLANPEWRKSGSFLIYSLVEPVDSSAAKLRIFDLGNTAFSILYYWQYYGLARACGLSGRFAWWSVLANFLLFGNNIFGFHRYYGMATTVLAQIGVVALARYAVHGVRLISYTKETPRATRLARWVVQFALFGSLLPLIAFNHVQGLALTAMALAGIWAWRLSRGHPARLFWLGMVYLMFNVVVVLLRPKHPDVAGLYQTRGWLNAWYGFDLFNLNSYAFERAMQICGLLGLINLAAGLLLAFRRPVVAWLTILPVVVLLSPAYGIFYTNAIAHFGPSGYEYIDTFHRLLLGIPSGLAICSLLALISPYLANSWRSTAPAAGNVTFAALAILLLLFTSLPASTPYYNRLWQVLMRVPNDLQMAHVAAATDLDLVKNQSLDVASRLPATPTFHVMATPGTGFVLSAFGNTMTPFRNKWMLYPVLSTPVNRLNSVQLALKPLIQQKQFGVVVVPAPATLTSSSSQAGFLSGHWLPNQVALEQAGAAELEREIAPYYSLRRDFHQVRIWRSK